jgi:hypothetical protein
MAGNARAWFLADGTALSFDTNIREMHASELTVTDNPVETGVVVSDHAYMQPDRLDMDARVSDVSIHGVNGADPFSSTEIDDFGDVSLSSVSRSQAAWKILTDLQRSAQPFQVQTGLKLYQNMVIISLSGTQDKDTANVLDFHVTLRAIEIVSTQTVTFPPRKPKKPSRTASPKVSSGEKSADPVTSPQSASLLLQSLWGAGIVSPQDSANAGAQLAAAQAAGAGQ